MNWRIRIQDFWLSVRKALGFNVYLCGSCRYNNPRDCRHRKRPNAIHCEDFRRK